MKLLMRAEVIAGDNVVGPAILVGDSLSRVYRQGDREVAGLRRVSITIRRGEFVAITGPSGSGKSTLMHLLGGLDKPDEGEVLLEGRSLTSLSDKELATVRRRRLGFVLQFFNLLPTLTAEENVAFPMLLDGERFAMERAAQALESVGLGHRSKHRPSQMSGGEQQRVAL
ncbi:MAG TPA: ATP-binding cassette domain-containing protein, partial [Actinomycetota bacterium]|nr:ATP-binding cassette domain-containing protein [Actinomycetota bacterium]